MSYKRNRLDPSGSVPSSDFSAALREAIHLINDRKIEQGLALLEKNATIARTPAQKAKIASLVAKTQFVLGRYEESVAQFDAAARLADDATLQQDHWLPAVTGKIRALLKSQKPAEAGTTARAAAAGATARQKAFEEQLSMDAGQLRQAGSIRVAARPLRINTVLTKIASTFWEDGYSDEAKVHLQQAISLTPNGASRARQLLATILLQEDKASEAEQLARESLLMGRFQAKTVASWQLLIEARAKQGKSLLDQDVYSAFLNTSHGHVADRSRLLILEQLRKRGDKSWRDIADGVWKNAVGHDPVIRFEAGKILLAEARLKANHQEAFRLANELFADARLSGLESIQVAKSIVEDGIMSGLLQDHAIASIQSSLSRRFGRVWSDRAVHGMALAAMMTKSFDLARSLLLGLCASVKGGSTQWSKSKWALGRMEQVVTDFSAAAGHFLDIADAVDVPPRFRLQAFLNWLKNIQKGSGEIDLESAKAKVQALVDSIEKPDVLLDAARQLALAGRKFQDICSAVTQQGEAKAMDEFNRCKDSNRAIGILNHLARRQFYDLQRSTQLVAFWESLPDDKIGWLWGKDARFWEYVALVGASYLNEEETSRGEEFLRRMLRDDTVPPCGRIHLLAALANWLVEEGRWAEAWPLYTEACQSHPGHRLTAHANYWLALRAFASSQWPEAEQRALATRKCLAPRPGLHWEWVTDGKTVLLLSRIHGNRDRIDARLYKDEFLDRLEGKLNRDLQALGS